MKRKRDRFKEWLDKRIELVHSMSEDSIFYKTIYMVLMNVKEAYEKLKNGNGRNGGDNNNSGRFWRGGPHDRS